MRKHNKRAQVSSLAVVLIFTIVIVLIIGTYSWGRSLLETHEIIATTNYVQSKLSGIENDVMEVVHEGNESSRSVRIEIAEGNLYISNGPHCSNSLPSSNGIAFNISASDQLIEATNNTWVSIDSQDNSTNCTDNYTEHKSGVLLGKSVHIVGETYMSEYMLWFRELEDNSGNKYFVNITTDSKTGVAGGSYTLNIKNEGTRKSGSIYITDVQVDIE